LIFGGRAGWVLRTASASISRSSAFVFAVDENLAAANQSFDRRLPCQRHSWATQSWSPEKLRSLREQPFDLDLGFAKSALSQNDGSSVARHRHLAARAMKRIANTPRPRADSPCLIWSNVLPSISPACSSATARSLI
jgi:hypothetical protein